MNRKALYFSVESLESRLLLAADLSVTYDTVPKSVRATEEIAYGVTVRNNGPDDAEEALIEISTPNLQELTWRREGPYSFPPKVDLATLNSDSGFSIDVPAFRAVAGDLNGDGIDDLVVASLPRTAYVVFGDQDIGSAGVFSKRGLDGTNGFAIEGVYEFYEVEGAVPDLNGAFRHNISILGDINGDGIDDMRIDRFVIFGSKTIGDSGSINVGEMDGNIGFQIETHSAYPTIGSAGDFNGDGIDDVLVASLNPRKRFVGEVWVHYGRPDLGVNGKLPVGTQDSSRRLLIEPATSEAIRFGSRISAAGDINNDGFDDILVTDRGLEDEMREAYSLILGGEYSRAKLTVRLNRSSDPHITRFLSGDRAFVSDRLSPMDWNGDGFDDLFLDDALVFGGSQGILDPSVFPDPGNLTLDDLIEKNGMRIASATHSLIDLNGDGLRDRISQSPRPFGVEFSVVEMEDLVRFSNSRPDGRTGVTFHVEGRNPGNGQPAGDINGDGIEDLLSVGSDQTYVLFGSRSFRSNGGPTESLSIPAGEEIRFEIAGFVPNDQSNEISNSVKVTLENGQDPNLANNAASSGETTVLPAELAPIVDLSVRLTQDAKELAPGDTVAYTLRVSNDGTTAAQAAHVSVTYENLLSPRWIRDDGETGDGPIDTRLDLFAGQTRTYTIQAKVGRDLSTTIDAAINAGPEQENSKFETATKTTSVPLRKQFPTVIGNVSICFDDTYAVGKDLFFVGWLSTDDAICFLTRAMASSGFHGGDLWKTDGTVEGTHMVKRIRPGRFDAFGDANGNGTEKLQFTEYNGLLFFAADDGRHGSELWRSDGTEAGTYLVKDINPTVLVGNYGASNQSSNIQRLQVVDDILAFRASDGTGVATWISDGSAEGTVKMEHLSLLPVQDGLGRYEVTHEKGQVIRSELNGENPIVVAERDIFVRNIHTWGENAIFNNVPESQYSGYDPLYVLDLGVDAVQAIGPTPFQPDLATDLMKSFATEVLEFKPSQVPRNDYRDEVQDDNPFEFLGNNPGAINFDTDGEFASITVGFPGVVVDGPGDDIAVKLDSRWDRNKQSIAVVGITATGDEQFLATLTPDTSFRGSIDLSTVDAVGPFAALRFEATENSRRLFSVEATIAASTVFAASAPNNLDYEFSWDLNHDGVYGDRHGRSIGLTKRDLSDYGIATVGEHPISVKMNDRVMDYFDETTFVVMEEKTLDALAGDVNDDGAVSFADFLILSAHYGQTDASREQGDLDGDGVVTFQDFIAIQKTFGGV